MLALLFAGKYLSKSPFHDKAANTRETFIAQQHISSKPKKQVCLNHPTPFSKKYDTLLLQYNTCSHYYLMHSDIGLLCIGFSVTECHLMVSGKIPLSKLASADRKHTECLCQPCTSECLSCSAIRGPGLLF